MRGVRRGVTQKEECRWHCEAADSSGWREAGCRRLIREFGVTVFLTCWMFISIQAKTANGAG